MTEKSHFKGDGCHRILSQPGVPDKGPVCLGDLMMEALSEKLNLDR